MLSSHHGHSHSISEPVRIPSSSTTTSQPYYPNNSNSVDEKATHDDTKERNSSEINHYSAEDMLVKQEDEEQTDDQQMEVIYDSPKKVHTAGNFDGTVSAVPLSPKKKTTTTKLTKDRSDNAAVNITDTLSLSKGGKKETSHSGGHKRSQKRKDLFIETMDSYQCALATPPGHSESPTAQSFLMATPTASSHSHSHSHSHSRSNRSSGTDNDHFEDCVHCNTPPANCRITIPAVADLVRRSSLSMMSPPLSAGLVKSATIHSMSSANSTSSPAPEKGRLINSNSAAGGRRSSLQQSNSNNLESTLQNQQTLSQDGSDYLATPTEPTFLRQFPFPPPQQQEQQRQPYPGYPYPGQQLEYQQQQLHIPLDCTMPFSAGVHPFDSISIAAQPWMGGAVDVTPNLTPAHLQYLQQFQFQQQQQQLLFQQQQGMMGQQHIDPLVRHAEHQHTQAWQGSQPMVFQRQTSLTAPPAPELAVKRGSKAKPKKRGASVVAASSAPPPSSSIIPLPQQKQSSQLQQPPQPQPQPQLQQQIQQSQRKVFQNHGPAPCGNPNPLYEYLASPTIVPGLEIIGHDFYGNYVQILPICPETTCLMNQDPIYLNLLQAIYAHTIPFLDLAPGSEQEIQALLNQGTPSAIATQSIQPPFKNLLPYQGHDNGGPGMQTQATRRNSTLAAGGAMSRMTSSVSSPSFQQWMYASDATGVSSFGRRASAATSSASYVSSPIVVSNTNGRRSSTTSIPSSTSSSSLLLQTTNNPAKRKKNATRTHPYKSTSCFKEDNSMVTEAILNEVGGIGGIGNSSAAMSATDPRRTKVTEKMVHMSEAEYASHYSRHHASITRSSSSLSSSMLLLNNLHIGNSSTRQLDMFGQPQRHSQSSSLMSSSVSAPSFALAAGTLEAAPRTGAVSMDSTPGVTGAADFIRALSVCGPVTTSVSLPDQGLQRLENLMLMDDAATAAIHAAAVASTAPISSAAESSLTSTAWPNWFDLHQLEKDVCEVGGRLARSSIFSSASSLSINKMPLSSSSTLTSFVDNTESSSSLDSRSSTDLLLSSSTNLAMAMMMDEDVDEAQTVRAPRSNHGNSTSQVLVFDPASDDQHQQQQHQQHQFLNVSSSTIAPSSLHSSSNRLSSTRNSSFNTIASSSSSPSTNFSSSEDTIMDESSDIHDDDQRDRQHNLRGGKSKTPRIKLEVANLDLSRNKDQDVHDGEEEQLLSKGSRNLVSNDLSVPYTSSLLTVLPFSAQHSHPIFPTRGHQRRQGWYRSKSVASQALTEITGVDYTTTCWYDVEQLQNVVRESISLQELSAVKPLEDLY
ncbi:hypothetical protein BGZ83_000181 [Gryganskiella cystojenkinii]|nr:hypothetical protein BGZ83_000181 [Gryganskiella cystojenkinii]